MATSGKVEIVTKSGRIIRVMPHLINDLAKFEATPKRPAARNTPKELLSIPTKSVLPKMEQSGKVIESIPENAVIEKPTRKAPVKSKSKK